MADSKGVPTTVKAARLIEDLEFYPRHDVDAINVAQLAEAIREGVTLPPLLVDRKTKTVVDGVHRLRAYLRVGGEEAEVPVVFQSYRTRAEMFVAAVEANAHHGLKLAPIDRARIVILCDHYQVEVQTVARIIHVRGEHLERLREEATATAPGGELTELKPDLRERYGGQKLTVKVMKVNDMMDGMPARYHLDLVCEMLEAETLDLDRPEIVEALRRLKGLLENVQLPLAAAA